MHKRDRKIVAIAIISVVTSFAVVSVGGVASARDAQPDNPTLHSLTSESVQDALGPQIVAAATTANARKVAYENAKAVVVTAQPNDGVIKLTIRACGKAHGWQSVAAANNISGPIYRVGLGQQLTVDCIAAAAAPADVYPVIEQRAPVAQQQPASAPAPQQQPAVNGDWTQPLAGKCYTSGFGWRSGRIHQGIDLPTPVGTPVHAVGSGSVSWGNDPGGAGWYIVLDHGGGLYTTYYHLSERWAQPGQWVNVGDIIGKSGGAKGAPGAGNSSGPHLHFEVHPWGKWTKRWNDALGANAYQNPAQWLGWVGAPVGRC
jgi:murein DD-endopeptidase MepM/ murein hydrolase activator NlpD